MPQFRKKPVVIEAMQFDGSNAIEISAFIGRELGLMDDDNPDVQSRKLLINTLEGQMMASYHDWIIKGVKGEFYPCKPDIFETTYEKVDAVTHKEQEIEKAEEFIARTSREEYRADEIYWNVGRLPYVLYHSVAKMMVEYAESTRTAQGRDECEWKEDEDGNWDTACDNKHIIIEGTPADNGMKFCCYCGRQLKSGQAKGCTLCGKTEHIPECPHYGGK